MDTIQMKTANLKFAGDLTPLNLSKIQYIVIHHAEAINCTAQDIHDWHLKKGWLGAAYNAFINKQGEIWLLRGDNQGAHCLDYNSISYGICCEGDYEVEQQMPEAQLQALILMVKYQLSRFANVQVVKHGTLIPTLCPGKYFTWDKLMEAIKGQYIKPSPLKLIPGVQYIKRGDKGAKVSELQDQLIQVGENPGMVDAIFGERTEAAVRHFQRVHGLIVDGIFGTQSNICMQHQLDKFIYNGSSLLVKGMRNANVTILQTQLIRRGFNPGAIDGIFGSHTEAAVKAFQRSIGLYVDGKVGEMTWEALL